MAPAFVVVARGIDPVVALVRSSVVLSVGIPYAVVSLISATSDRSIMGSLVNRRITNVMAIIIATNVMVMNTVLPLLTVTG